ncbi:MAG: hypothetical protein U0520_03260 [Candidatus Saccharimonadales bacterium]
MADQKSKSKKNKSPAKHVISGAILKVWLYIKVSMHNLVQWCKKQPGQITKTVLGVPTWMKSRPKAIKQWLREARKKKKYRSFRLQKKIKPEPRYIPSSTTLLRGTLRFIWQNKKIFFYIFLIHLLLYVIIIRSPVSTNIDAIRDSIDSVLGENSQKTSEGTLATLGTVLTLSATNQTNVTVSGISVLLMSLVYVWAIRELHVHKDIKARDAYYNSMAPLMPVVLVLVVLSAQLIPFAGASFVYGTARTSGLFANGFEDIAIFTAAVLVGLMSFYWITSTVVAFYIATLQGMYPMQALRNAKKLVQFQRFTVFKRILALPIMLGLIYILLLALTVRFATNQIFVIIEFLQLIGLPVLHVYLYKLYRALI